jgi:hypothetical protein
MTTMGKAAIVTAGVVGVVALGVAMTPTIRDQWAKANAPQVETTAAPAPAPEPSAAPAAKKGERRVASAKSAARDVEPEIAPVKREPNVVETVAVSQWEPELRDRVKAVLNPGSKPELAAADFANAEQFMTVAHAARNTQVPFMVLKHRVLNERQSLAEAIHEFKPALDAKAEVQRARVAAREDLDIASNN